MINNLDKINKLEEKLNKISKEDIEKAMEKLNKISKEDIEKAMEKLNKEIASENDIYEGQIINITLEELFSILSDCVINNKEIPDFYYERQNWYNGFRELVRITEVDLMSGRFKTIDNDFSEYDWEKEKSHIYMGGGF